MYGVTEKAEQAELAAFVPNIEMNGERGVLYIFLHVFEGQWPPQQA